MESGLGFHPKLYTLHPKPGSLRNSSLGEEVDAHDMVVRVNQGPTRGYERDVGRTTDVRILNHKWSKVRLARASSQ